MTVAKMHRTATMNQRLRSDGDFSMADLRPAYPPAPDLPPNLVIE